MATAVNLKNPTTGQTKVGYVGFSWTTLFFGFFPALFRGDFFTFIAGMVFSITTSIIASVIKAQVFFDSNAPHTLKYEDLFVLFFSLIGSLVTFFIYFIPIMMVIGAIWAFMYNNYYTRKLIGKGYVLNDSPEVNKLAAEALGISLNNS